MSGYSAAEGTRVEERYGHVSVPLVIVSALLCGLGLLGMFFWLYTFNFLYFSSVILLGIGAYLLFTRATGPERA